MSKSDLVPWNISSHATSIRPRDPAELAYEIALENNIASFNDLLFWAVAEREEARLLVLDQKMYEK
jgi:hypothetical protein